MAASQSIAAVTVPWRMKQEKSSEPRAVGDEQSSGASERAEAVGGGPERGWQ